MLYIVTGIFSLCIGSFLNVVIYRLPLMLEKEWKQQCEELLYNKEQHDAQTFNLMKPNSTCPKCKQSIKFWHNIPVLSYLLLGGKCAYCKVKISSQYLFIEVICAALSVFAAIHFGFGWALLGCLILTWSLIPMVAIDLKHQLLPDNITLPLLWLGLIFNLFSVYTNLNDAVIGAIAGYSSLWLFTYAYKMLTGKIGMGHGDFKLFAVFGAWLGWQILPLLIVFSALFGAIFGIIWLSIHRKTLSTALPFGPYIAVVGWVIFMFSDTILHWYYSLMF